MTEPCDLKVGQNLYKCIDDVLTEVDSRGWELMQLGGDGNHEGGWKYVFRKKPTIVAVDRTKPDITNDTSPKPKTPMSVRLKTRSQLRQTVFIGRPFMRRKRSDSF